MTEIFQGFGNTKYVVNHIADDVCVDETYVPITDADVGGVRVVTATWPDFNCTLDGLTYFVAAGHIHLNAVDVASPTTYYVYFTPVAGVPTAVASTTNPITNPAVDEYFLTNIVRFKSVGGTVTYYFNKYPTQNGLYELAHNIKEDSMFYDPAWIEGIAPTLAAGGKLSTTVGYVRFPGNEPRQQIAITNGALMLEDESASVVGLDNIGTYASTGGAVGADMFFKLLVGVIRDKGGLNSAKYIVCRQSKPAVEYDTAAKALADGERMAATAFPSAYKAAVTPLCYVITMMGKGATSDYTQGAVVPAGQIIDLRESGLTGAAGGGASIVSHGALANLNVVADHQGYVTLDGTRDLTGDWSVTKDITTTGDLSASQVISSIADGTKPFSVTSKTMSTNLNADMVDGIHGANIVTADGLTALTGNWDVGAFEVRAQTLYLDKADGTAPMTITSKTVSTNLNADMLDGKHAVDVVLVDGSQAMTGALNMGGKSITTANDVGCTTVTASGNAKALTLQSTEAVTAPLVVASTAVVTNLNADTVDGSHAAAFAVAAKGVTNGDTHDHTGGAGAQIAHSGLSGLTSGNDHTQYLLKDGTVALTGNWTGNSKNITTTGTLTGGLVVSTMADGTAPLTITSKTVTTNLNADMLDGLHDTSFLKADGTVALTGNMSVNAGVTIDGVDIGDHAANTNAHHNAVTVTGATGVLTLATQDISMDTTTTSKVLAGPVVGAASPAAPAYRVLNIQDIARPSGSLTLANGANNNVALTAGVRVVTITGPTAAFGITGLTGGTDGAVLYIVNNAINQNLTLYHEDSNSTAANRIWSSTGADVTSNKYGTFTLLYIAGTVNRWIIVSSTA